MHSTLNTPHGGELIDLMADGEGVSRLWAECIDYPSLTLNNRQLGDLELLLNGWFSPLTGFPGRADYDSVVSRMWLTDGT